jgi:pyruvate/2-oxoglutarate dehydrogenase complex dihydrolipoamide dehydrogenase (E3) component
MTELLQCDIAIIGGGAGGLSIAAVASQLGAQVVLVESGRMGGDCLNYGCVPSKSLLAAAKSFYHAKQADYFGVQANNIRLDFKKVMEHVHRVIAKIGEHDSIKRFESLGVRVIQAEGCFIDDKTLQAGDVRVQAKRFVIATGSSPFIPPIPGLEHIRYETNETIFNLESQPQHLIIVGGGPIGCELAQAFAMLGCQVTILEAFKLLPKDDTDCVAILRKQFEHMNIGIHEGVAIQEVTQKDAGVLEIRCEFEGKSLAIQGSHILVATGRRANVTNLALEKAGVTYSPKGIQVDKRLRTSNRKIYAIGDVVGFFQFTHTASYHAGIVLRNILFKFPAKVDDRAIPWVIYTEPEMAHVGLTTEEATQCKDIKITEWPYSENDRAQAEHTCTGKIKVISDTKGRILGATIVGASAGELILPWVMAIREGKKLRYFTDTVVPYPTLNELSKRVAGQFYAPQLFSKTTRWLVYWLQKLG